MRIAAVIALVSFGCLEPSGTFVWTDSTQHVFETYCESDGCETERLTEAPRPPCSEGEIPFYNWGWGTGRYLHIHAACRDQSGSGWRGDWERPAICKTDDDCAVPFVVGYGYSYECRFGLCQNLDTERYPVEEVKPADVRLLCYATIPREEVFDPFQGYDHNQEVNAKVESVCGSDYQRDDLCETPLPDSCLQPF